MSEKRKRVVVAMSGGVDSSVACARVLEAGHEVVGVTLQLMPKLDSSFGCCGSPEEMSDAKRVCEALGVPHYTINMAELFQNTVINPFIDAYLHGRTPNPCVECNRSVKFDHLLKLIEAYDCDLLATGHYARIVEHGGETRLARAADLNKDQTYFLYTLREPELKKLMFPLGDITKDETRAIARRLGLKTAEKPESQEICFVPSNDYRSFLKKAAAGSEGLAKAGAPGPIVDSKGNRLGEHQGLLHYTVGQRKGLGLSGPEPYYVVALRPETNTLVVGRDADTLSKDARVTNVVWSAHAPEAELEVKVRLRHRHEAAPARIRWDGAAVSVVFEEAQRAVAPGQSAVFYDGETVIGGGFLA